MSKLDQLIWELCPDGVEFKALKEIATVFRGGNFQKKDFIEKGFPCIHYGQIYILYGLFADKTFSFISEECARRQKIAHKNDIIMAVTSENLDDVCKCMAWLGDGNVAISGHSVIIRHNQNAKFLTYFFQTEMFSLQKKRLAHGTKVIEISSDKLLSIVVPVPPLPVQQEIVRILDNFTLLTAELTAKLTAELTARKKQYAYYRDKLLTISPVELPKVQLSKIALSITSGGTPISTNHVYYDKGTIPWLRTQEVNFCDVYDTEIKITESGLKESSAKLIPENCVIVAMYGATVGKIAINKIPLTTNQACCNLEIDESKALYKYIYHCLANKYQYIKSLGQGSQTNINMQIIKSLEIPLPSLDVQQRIVDVLDNFEKICSDLNIGLPAEIEARKKQYEYYRDALLTFAETGDIIFTDRQTDRQTDRI